jgi:hypothetical protein
MEHFKKYAKAYSGGISAGGIGPAAATIVLWLIGLSGVEVPAEVKSAIECLVAAGITAAVVAKVGNADTEPLARIDWVKRIRGRD